MSPLPTGGTLDAVGFVLAGGQSTRMGSDKALIDFDGQPLIARALSTLREAGLQASIAGGRSDLSRFAPVIPDPGEGPLTGVCAALAQASSEFAVFFSVDMPCFPASFIKVLINYAWLTRAAATLPSINGFAQTFPVVLHRSTLPHLETALGRAEGGCFAAFKHASHQVERPFYIVRTEMLTQAGQVTHPAGLPGAYWFLNVNTPQELARALVVIQGQDRVI